MTTSSRSAARPHVVIAGGGFAGLEAALALTALAADRVRLTIVCADRELLYGPAATLEAFGEDPPRRHQLAVIADDLRAKYREGRLEAVVSRQKHLRLSSGAWLSYDMLVLAIGARARAGIPGALTFSGQRDVPTVRRLLGQVDDGLVRRLVFAIPKGYAWPLPLYELALLTATRAQERHADTQLTLVTPEAEPLAVFGARASQLVRGLLAELGVRFIGGTAASFVRRDGALGLESNAPLQADRVVAAPQLRGRRVTGVPANEWGFVPTDASGCVEGLIDVYAAGDMTAFPIKHGALAAQQADRIAHKIAERLGAPTKECRSTRVLLARLLGGERTLCLRTELDQLGRPTTATIEHVEASNPERSAKVFGRYLTPYLERA